MRKSIYLITALLCIAGFCSCTRTNVPEQENDDFQKEQLTITASKTDAILYPEDIPLEIVFTVVSEREITEINVSVPSGVNVEKQYCAENKTGKVVLKANGSFPDNFTATIEAKANDSLYDSATVNVRKAFLVTDRDSFQVMESGASIIVEVSTNLSYSLLCEADWVSVERKNSSMVSVTIDRNREYTPRSASIKISEPHGTLDKSITLSQDAATNYYEKEIAALKAIFQATDGEHWLQLSTTVSGLETSTAAWCTDKALNQWYGVEINGEGHVIHLHLNSLGLNGTIPEEIGDLIYCQELWLSGNNLSGSLPSRIGEMQSLKDFSADGMSLSGDLASSSLSAIAGRLKSLSLSGNNFTGEFPTWIGEMPQTCNFWLQGNRLSGKIPENVRSHPNWSQMLLDGSGKTVGQLNMKQQEGFLLYE